MYPEGSPSSCLIAVSVVMLQSTLAQTLQQTKAQLEACREAKHRLEMDWSDKYTAQGLGTVQYTLHYIYIVIIIIT